MISIVEEDATCSVTRDGQVLFRQAVAFDPGRALALLLEVNALKDADGAPIYTRFVAQGTAVWAMLQEHLFWEYLQPFVKYRAILEWLQEHQVRDVSTDIPGVRAWVRLLAPSKNGEESGSSGNCCRVWIEKFFLCCNAFVVGVLGRVRQAQFLLWSLNCVWGSKWIDYRLKDVYASLWAEGITFIEGFPFPGFKVAAKRLLGSRRIPFYAPNFLRIVPEGIRRARHFRWRFESVSRMPAELLNLLIRHFEILASNVVVHSDMMNALYRLAGIRRVVGIDEHTSYAALLCSARKMEIETMGLQHGVFHKYSIGWTTPGIPSSWTVGYDRVAVWGDYWTELLSQLSTTYSSDRLPAVGFIRPSTISLKRRTAQPAAEQFRILLPYEFLANPEEIAQFVRAFHERGFKTLFKVRFDDTIDDQLRLLPREYLELVPELTQEIVDSIHVCAGTSTTMMYELYSLGIPSWFLETRHDSNIHMVEKGLATRITLEMLADSTFNPFHNLIEPRDPDRIFAPGGIPNFVVRMCSHR